MPPSESPDVSVRQKGPAQPGRLRVAWLALWKPRGKTPWGIYEKTIDAIPEAA